MVDDIIGKKSNYQENKGTSQDGYEDKGETCVPLHSDQSSRTARWVSGMG